MEKKIRTVVVYGEHYWHFYYSLSARVRKRIDWTVGLVEYLPMVPEQYLKHITGTDLYEIRVGSGRNIFRIFCFFEEGRVVILLNGFQKKTEKTPPGEIERALQLKKQYYEHTENQDRHLRGPS